MNLPSQSPSNVQARFVKDTRRLWSPAHRNRAVSTASRSSRAAKCAGCCWPKGAAQNREMRYQAAARPAQAANRRQSLLRSDARICTLGFGWIQVASTGHNLVVRQSSLLSRTITIHSPKRWWTAGGPPPPWSAQIDDFASRRFVRKPAAIRTFTDRWTSST